MDFSIDKATSTVFIKREFDASIKNVWAAWTESDLLDLWWAPKPWQSKTKSMDFKAGGKRLYAMHGPEGEEHWALAEFKSITPTTNFKFLDAFCDSNGKINKDFPRSEWDVHFSESHERTMVNISIKHQSMADLEKIIALGFKEGFTMALGNLDQYIEAQEKLRSELRTDNKPRVCNYLNFPGNTEEAFLFYRSVFKTEFGGDGIHRFGSLPADADHPPIDESVKNMVLLVELPITANHIIMGTDAPKEKGFTVITGNNMHISIEPETRAEADRIFNSLSAGGNVTMPLQDMFWGAYFGSFTDKYNINWMVNHVTKK